MQALAASVCHAALGTGFIRDHDIVRLGMCARGPLLDVGIRFADLPPTHYSIETPYYFAQFKSFHPYSLKSRCHRSYHLVRQAGFEGDVIVLERDQLTSGTTWHAAGLMVTFGSTSSTSTDFRKCVGWIWLRVLGFVSSFGFWCWVGVGIVIEAGLIRLGTLHWIAW